MTKQPVKLPASRIRRDPPAKVEPIGVARQIWWGSPQWETRSAIVGIIFFAIASCAVVIDVGQLLLG